MQAETSETAVKKTVQKLQRAIVDGLEDVKAQDIRVFDTEHLSALFERVVVASGNTNRQTRALAASVRDAVRQAGFDKPRIEGEENGEWIIVDCGAAVVHIMQPAIRQYYTLEDIWGEKPVRMRIGKARAKAAVKKIAENSTKAAKPAAKKMASRTASTGTTKATAKKAAAGTATVADKKTASKPATQTVHKKPTRAAASAAAKASPKTSTKASTKTSGKAAAKPAAKSTPAKKTAASKKTT